MEKQLFEKNPILKLAFDFSLMVISYCEILDSKKSTLYQSSFLNPVHLSALMQWKPKMQKVKLTLYIK